MIAIHVKILSETSIPEKVKRNPESTYNFKRMNFAKKQKRSYQSPYILPHLFQQPTSGNFFSGENVYPVLLSTRA